MKIFSTNFKRQCSNLRFSDFRRNPLSCQANNKMYSKFAKVVFKSTIYLVFLIQKLCSNLGFSDFRFSDFLVIQVSGPWPIWWNFASVAVLRLFPVQPRLTTVTARRSKYPRTWLERHADNTLSAKGCVHRFQSRWIDHAPDVYAQSSNGASDIWWRPTHMEAVWRAFLIVIAWNAYCKRKSPNQI